MGRPRTPTAVLERRGAFEHDPQRGRARANEPKPTGSLGEPPESFAEDEGLLKVWRDLAEHAPPQVLTNADRWLVELACVLMKRVRSGEAKSGDFSRLLACLSRMGMTPADRSRVGVAAKTDEPDPWDEFAARDERQPN